LLQGSNQFTCSRLAWNGADNKPVADRDRIAVHPRDVAAVLGAGACGEDSPAGNDPALSDGGGEEGVSFPVKWAIREERPSSRSR
jgi:hypothetical protein